MRLSLLEYRPSIELDAFFDLCQINYNGFSVCRSQNPDDGTHNAYRYQQRPVPLLFLWP